MAGLGASEEFVVPGLSSGSVQVAVTAGDGGLPQKYRLLIEPRVIAGDVVRRDEHEVVIGGLLPPQTVAVYADDGLPVRRTAERWEIAVPLIDGQSRAFYVHFIDEQQRRGSRLVRVGQSVRPRRQLMRRHMQWVALLSGLVALVACGNGGGSVSTDEPGDRPELPGTSADPGIQGLPENDGVLATYEAVQLTVLTEGTAAAWLWTIDGQPVRTDGQVTAFWREGGRYQVAVSVRTVAGAEEIYQAEVQVQGPRIAD